MNYRYSEVNKKLIIKNAISNYGRYIVEAVIVFFLQAYLIRSLGKEEYSYWPIVRSVLSFIGILSVGIGGGTARFLSYYLGKGDIDKVKKIITTMFLAYGLLGFLYVALAIYVALDIDQFIRVTPYLKSKVITALILAGLSNGINLPFSVFNAVLRSLQKYIILNVMQIISQLLKLGFIILLFSFYGPSIVIIAFVTILLTVFTASWELLFSFRYLGFSGISIKNGADIKVLKEIGGFSLFLLISYFAGKLYWETDNILINRLLDTSLVTGYSVVASFVLEVYMITTLGIRVLMPPMTILNSQGKVDQILQLIDGANRTVVPLAGFLLVFFSLWGGSFLKLYIGEEYMRFGIIFAVLSIPELFSAMQAVSSILVQAYGRMEVVSIISLFVAVANVVLSIIFVRTFGLGIIGIALGTAVVMILHKLFFWPWYGGKLTGVGYWRYFKITVVRPIFVLLPAVLVMLSIYVLFREFDSWFELLGFAGGLGLLSIFSVIKLGLKKEEREALWQWTTGIFWGK